MAFLLCVDFGGYGVMRKVGSSVVSPLSGRYVLGEQMKFISIVESILHARFKRREDARSGRIKNDYAEQEFKETLDIARKCEPAAYEKYKDE
ncbi:hypothetical protein P0F20_003282 [Vibrio metschnikovii]|nr:hypothetical protein [Vibrio metschnikovii]